MKLISLSRGMNAMVDDTDYERLSKYKWYAAKRKHRFYACTTITVDGRRTHIKMHRMIMTPNAGYDIDHINGDGLDNQRLNLRICTRSENMCNPHYRGNTFSSRYKGVRWHKDSKSWHAAIQHNGKKVHLGKFNSEEYAAIIYQIAKEQRDDAIMEHRIKSAGGGK